MLPVFAKRGANSCTANTPWSMTPERLLRSLLLGCHASVTLQATYAVAYVSSLGFSVDRSTETKSRPSLRLAMSIFSNACSLILSSSALYCAQRVVLSA
jgi:hypothetical protein